MSFLREAYGENRVLFQVDWFNHGMCAHNFIFNSCEWELKGMINPCRGISQGNPLSPFLFLLCTECLHRLIKKVARSKEINDFSLCKRGSKLTHLFFANDSLLFSRAN